MMAMEVRREQLEYQASLEQRERQILQHVSSQATRVLQQQGDQMLGEHQSFFDGSDAQRELWM